jgi:hypothetical protein
LPHTHDGCIDAWKRQIDFECNRPAAACNASSIPARHHRSMETLDYWLDAAGLALVVLAVMLA